jgi:hypothetical protein
MAGNRFARFAQIRRFVASFELVTQPRTDIVRINFLGTNWAMGREKGQCGSSELRHVVRSRP